VEFKLESVNTEGLSTRVLRLEFKNKSQTTHFIRWQFYSSLLHSFAPNNNSNIWEKGNRLDVCIKGWSKSIIYKREKDNVLISNQISTSWIKEHFKLYKSILQQSISEAITGKIINNIKIKRFYIGNDKKGWEKYDFNSASREVVALCLLYDKKPKARDQLELWLSPQDYPSIPNSPHNNWPENIKREKRFYGDPSKTVEALSQQGWERHGENATITVSKDIYGGNRQEFYTLLKRKQDLSQQTNRVNIPSNWRISIFERDEFTCLYCGRQYSRNDLNDKTGMHKYLDPDHRIPVNVSPDKSNDTNFHDTIITLCKTCNQRKREVTKKIQTNSNYDWKNEEWAFPDKPSFIFKRIHNLLIFLSRVTKKPLKFVLDDTYGKLKDIITKE
jgi:hypothetical protein